MSGYRYGLGATKAMAATPLRSAQEVAARARRRGREIDVCRIAASTHAASPAGMQANPFSFAAPAAPHHRPANANHTSGRVKDRPLSLEVISLLQLSSARYVQRAASVMHPSKGASLMARRSVIRRYGLAAQSSTSTAPATCPLARAVSSQRTKTDSVASAAI